MSDLAKATKPRRFKLDVPLTPSEQVEFRAFCDETGRAQGPWTRTLIIKAMADERALRKAASE